MDAYLINGTIKPYAWGDDVSIARLIGKEASGEIMAEYWLGAHPDSPATLDGKRLSLFELVSNNPELLGKHTELPFLFKILAIAQPLAIQCHPTKAQAEVGWAAEAQKRELIDHEFWNYKDRNQKAELLFALSDVVALYGFKPLDRIKADLKEVIPSYSEVFDKTKTVREFFHTLYHLDLPLLRSMISELSTTLDHATIEGKIAQEAIGRYENDPAVFGPYFMNVITLSPGEGIFVPPREIHAYVSGVGIELMNNSDNVLRAGLTKRPSDIAEFEKIMLAEVTGPTYLEGEPQGIVTRYPVASNEFTLYTVTSGRTSFVFDQPTILFAHQGKTTLTSGSTELTLNAGGACFVGSTVGECILDVETNLFIATP